MPVIMKPCGRPGCRELVPKSGPRFCPKHGAVEADRHAAEERARSAARRDWYGPDWRKARREHLARNPACVKCGTTERLEVHHKIGIRKRPDLRLDPANLETRCVRCHAAFTATEVGWAGRHD
jgi:5-methylcytosine-specific restriction endonuclease McrA